MLSKKKYMRGALFCVIAILFFGAINYIVNPIWLEWNNYSTTRGFYKEEKNTIETIFVGASIIVNGITPMELYENYGICSYNLGTEQQPMLASYYWVEEAYRLHPETLKTVVLDVSMLRRTPDDAFYRKALEAMQFSEVKYHAIKEYTTNFTELVSYLVPVLSYHDRWKVLTDLDFNDMEKEVLQFTRGYNFVTTKLIDLVNSFTEISVPCYILDENAGESTFNLESLFYLKRMIAFCSEHNVKLVLIKTPVIGSWSSSDHNAVQNIVDVYGLDFLDFNFSPYLDDLGYNHAIDSWDGGHMNYNGARKLSRWIGDYLVNECDNTDVRGYNKYSFLESELEDYKRCIMSAELEKIVDPCIYISSVMSREGYVLFVSVKDEASFSLSDEQRKRLNSLGLIKLSELTYRKSYLAVIDDGRIVIEKSETAGKENYEKEQGSDNEERINDMENIEHVFAETVSEKGVDEEKYLPIVYTGKLADGTAYKVTSGGMLSGCVSSCQIEGMEYSPNHRGLNFVLYDKVLSRVVDVSFFDTYASSERESQDFDKILDVEEDSEKVYTEFSGASLELYKYNLMCEDVKKAIEIDKKDCNDALVQYLQEYGNDKKYIIFISVMDDGSLELSGETKELLDKFGLRILTKLEFGDLYAAMVYEGKVLQEERGGNGKSIAISELGYKIECNETETGSVSLIRINEMEYSSINKGINIVVYNLVTETIVNERTFN